MVMEIIAFSYFEVSIRLIIWKSLYQLRHAFIVFMGTTLQVHVSLLHGDYITLDPIILRACVIITRIH